MPSGKNGHHPGWKPSQGSASDRIPGWAPRTVILGYPQAGLQAGSATRYEVVHASKSSELLTDASPEVMNQAEAILATQAADAAVVEGVLLSTDLAPHVLALLQLEDSAAAAVCSLWAEG